MKKALFTLALSFAFSLAAVAQLTPAELALGLWEKHSPDGTSMIVAFRPGGTLTVSTAQVLEFAAKISGNDLSASVQQNGKPSDIRIHVEADALTYMEAEVPYRWVRLSRVSAGQPAFAGVWVLDTSTQPQQKKRKPKKGTEGLLMPGGTPLPPEMLAEVRMLITPDGKVQVRLPIELKEGAYTVQPDKILMMYGGRVFSYAYRFADEKLYMIAQGEGSESAFRRLE